MNGIFNMDGPFFRFGNALADIIILSLVWFVVSLPLVTVGASTTALFYVTTRRISNREGYLLKDFFSSFKANFKQATLLWILWVAVVALVITNLFWLRSEGFNPTLAGILFPLQIIILIELIMIVLYIFPLTARFDMKFFQTIKSAFFMANRHLLTTISCLCILIGIYLAAEMFFPPILVVAAGIYAYLSSYMIMNLFKKYRPEIDSDDLANEPLAPIRDVEDRKDG